MRDKILVTGSAGFIGFHLCRSLLEDDFEIMGIDIINDYYDKELKYNRLKNSKNLIILLSKKTDISDKDELSKVFINFKPTKSR